MSKFSRQDIINEKGKAVFCEKYNETLFDVSDFGPHDKTPDIDGRIRLRDGKSKYLNRYLHYQLKSKTKVVNNKFYCSHRIIEYFLSTNIPTVLIVVDVTAEKVFWHYIDPKDKKYLVLCKNGQGTTLDLNRQEFREDNQLKIHSEWLSISNDHSYENSKTKLREIADDFETNLTNLMGLLFLLQKIEKENGPDILSVILNINSGEIQAIIRRLLEKQLVISTKNFYLVEDERIGRESLNSLIDEVELEDIFNVIKTKEDKSLIFRQLADVKHEKVNTYFKNTAIGTFNLIKTRSNNNTISKNLELLEYYAFRVPDIALKIITYLIREKEIKRDKAAQQQIMFFDIYGRKSNTGIILKCIDILKELRYIETKSVFDILFNLSNSSNETIKQSSCDALKAIISYNLFAIKAIQYKPQLIVMNAIEKLRDSQKSCSYVLICEICSALLEPSFEGHSMKDYKTAVFSRGALLPTDELIDLRNRTISYLQKMFHLAETTEQKIVVLNSLEEATITPYSSK